MPESRKNQQSGRRDEDGVYLLVEFPELEVFVEVELSDSSPSLISALSS